MAHGFLQLRITGIGKRGVKKKGNFQVSAATSFNFQTGFISEVPFHHFHVTKSSGFKACPDGWHLPSDTEWKQPEMHLGMSQAEADLTRAESNSGQSCIASGDRWNGFQNPEYFFSELRKWIFKPPFLVV